MFSSVKHGYLLLGISAHTQLTNVLCLVIRAVTLPALRAGFLNGEAQCSSESGYPCSWSCGSGPGHVALLLPVREINTGLHSPPLQHLSLEQSSYAFNMWGEKKKIHVHPRFPSRAACMFCPGCLHVVIPVWMHCLCSWKL